jgi:hypothetical protein
LHFLHVIYQSLEKAPNFFSCKVIVPIPAKISFSV